MHFPQRGSMKNICSSGEELLDNKKQNKDKVTPQPPLPSDK